MNGLRIPDAYAARPRDWSTLTHAVARATYDHPRITADRLTRYVECHIERYGRAPDFRAFKKEHTEVAA